VVSGRKKNGFVKFSKLLHINISVYIWEKATYVFRIHEFDAFNLPYITRGLKIAMGLTENFKKNWTHNCWRSVCRNTLPLHTASKLVYVFDFSGLSRHLQTKFKEVISSSSSGCNDKNFLPFDFGHVLTMVTIATHTTSQLTLRSLR